MTREQIVQIAKDEIRVQIMRLQEEMDALKALQGQVDEITDMESAERIFTETGAWDWIEISDVYSITQLIKLGQE